MEWYVILMLVLVIPIILFPAAFVWYLNIGGIYAAIRAARKRSTAREHEEVEAGALAFIGRQVKPGVLALGRSMRVALPIAVPVGVYGFLIWFFLASLGWWVALALGLTIPVVLIPVAFVWYLNVSGLYRVISDARQRQKRRAKVLGEVQLKRGRVVAPAAVESKT